MSTDTPDDSETRDPPATLAEMQNMTTVEFRQVSEFKYRGTMSPKRLIQHLIRLADRELSWQGEQDATSLRGLWYNPTKAILQEAFPDKLDNPSFDFNRRMSQYLSETLSEMVQNGETSYRSLNILDASREREVHPDSVESDKILFVEKDVAYENLKPLEQVYEITLVSGSGWQATALIEDLSHELEDVDPDDGFDLYVLSDYDPTGYRIVEDFRKRAEKLGIPLDGEPERIGIDPEHVDTQTLREQTFKPPENSDYDTEWLERHGIDGDTLQPTGGEFGLEIDALGDLQEGGEPLRRLVVEELKPDIREERRYEKDTATGVANTAHGAARRAVQQITGDLENALEEAAAEIVADLPGVKKCYKNDMGLISAAVDYDEVLENYREVDGLPTPPKDDQLHEGAVTGRYSGARTQRAKRAVADELQERIEEGEINVADLLDVGE